MNLKLAGFVLVLGIAALTNGAFAAFEERETEPQPMNVLFILVDDLGCRDLGCDGSTFHETPHIDRLASSGFHFTSAYAAGSVCSPTRAALLTGRYPARVKITDWIPGRRPKNQKLKQPAIRNELGLDERTMAEAFKESGYRTFFAGKWHLGGEGFFPEDQGFQINLGGHHRGSPPGGYFSPYRNPKLTDGPKGEYLPDRLTSESIRFMKENKDSPFFLYLSYYTVHTPIQARKKYLKKYREKAEQIGESEIAPFIPERDGWTKTRQDNPDYATMVAALDENIGRLMNALDELELADNTIVVFTSDNGGLSTLYGKRAPTSQYPLRAGKGWLYEGGIRIPLIIRAPQKKPGQSDVPVISMDLFPTLLDLTGMEPRSEQHLDGKSLTPLLDGKTMLDRPALFWHYPHYHGSAWTPGAAVRAGNWKLVHHYEYDEIELYDLAKDPGEQKNLASKLPEKRDKLMQSLVDWQKDVGAELPEPANSQNRPKAKATANH